jgi:hypothetical protein
LPKGRDFQFRKPHSAGWFTSLPQPYSTNHTAAVRHGAAFGNKDFSLSLADTLGISHATQMATNLVSAS